MLTLVLTPDKKLTAVNNSKIYYGENRIGNISIKVYDKIGEINTADCNFKLYVLLGGEFIEYSLDFSENNICSIPITDDITEFVGRHEMFIEISGNNQILGKTNSVYLKVYPRAKGDTEIVQREVYIAQIEDLSVQLTELRNVMEDIKDAIIYWGSSVGENTPISEYGNLIRNIDGIPSSIFRGTIDGSISENVIVPNGAKKIKDYLFYCCYSLIGCNMPNTIESIGQYSFANCTNITSAVIPRGVKTLGYYAFGNDYILKDLYIPNTLTSVNNSFNGCRSLENVTLENGFNCNSLNLSVSSLYSAETIVSWLHALADRTGKTAYTFTIGSNNLAKLTAAQIAIATNKNWNLA